MIKYYISKDGKSNYRNNFVIARNPAQRDDEAIPLI